MKSLTILVMAKGLLMSGLFSGGGQGGSGQCSAQLT